MRGIRGVGLVCIAREGKNKAKGRERESREQKKRKAKSTCGQSTEKHGETHSLNAKQQKANDRTQMQRTWLRRVLGVVEDQHVLGRRLRGNDVRVLRHVASAMSTDKGRGQ